MQYDAYLYLWLHAMVLLRITRLIQQLGDITEQNTVKFWGEWKLLNELWRNVAVHFNKNYIVQLFIVLGNGRLKMQFSDLGK